MSNKKTITAATKQEVLSEAKQLHNSISQVASIRLQTELIMLGLEQEAQDVRSGLSTIVELTQGLQETLSELLATQREKR